jgi:hypothetical protein
LLVEGEEVENVETGEVFEPVGDGLLSEVDLVRIVEDGGVKIGELGLWQCAALCTGFGRARMKEASGAYGDKTIVARPVLGLCHGGDDDLGDELIGVLETESFFRQLEGQN